MTPSVRNVVILGGRVRQSDIAKTDAKVSTADSSVYTFAACNLGAADPARLIIIAGTYRSATGVTISSLTVGGVSAAIDVESRNTSGGAVTSAYIGRAVVPSGATGDVVLTLSGAAVRASATVYATTKYNSVIPNKTAASQRGSVGVIDLSLASNPTGFAVGVAQSPDSSNNRHTSAFGHILAKDLTTITVDGQVGNATWVGMTEDTDMVIESGGNILAAAVSAAWAYA